jgi:hypothetical protein
MLLERNEKKLVDVFGGKITDLGHHRGTEEEDGGDDCGSSCGTGPGTRDESLKSSAPSSVIASPLASLSRVCITINMQGQTAGE